MSRLVAIFLFLLIGCTTAETKEEAVTKDGNAPLLMPANMQCLSYSVMTKVLFDQYRETQVAAGVLATGQGQYIANLFKSELGTWTLIITNPESVSCVLGYGDRWVTAKPPEGA
tara:strand:- start:687 stop:1028 length:342 start_codon:yes stop_codon:yes gene_type:complete